jgi:hypothetical protein
MLITLLHRATIWDAPPSGVVCRTKWGQSCMQFIICVYHLPIKIKGWGTSVTPLLIKQSLGKGNLWGKTRKLPIYFFS